jgi:hypothetical protein
MEASVATQTPTVRPTPTPTPVNHQALQTKYETAKIISKIFDKFSSLPDTVQFMISDGKKEVVLSHKSLLGFVNGVKNGKMKENLLKFFTDATLSRLAMRVPGQYTNISLNDVMVGTYVLPDQGPTPVKSSDLMPKTQQSQGKGAPVAVPVAQNQQPNGKKVNETKPSTSTEFSENTILKFSEKFIVGILEELGYLDKEKANEIVAAYLQTADSAGK